MSWPPEKTPQLSSRSWGGKEKVKARLHFLHRLKRVELPILAMTLFYRGTIESILTDCISFWFSNRTVEERQELNRIVKTAQKNHWRLIAASAGRIHNALHAHSWPHFPFMGCSHSCSQGKVVRHENKDYSVGKQLLSHSNQTANPENVDCTNKQLHRAFLWLEFNYLFTLSSDIFNSFIHTFLISLFSCFYGALNTEWWICER